MIPDKIHIEFTEVQYNQLMNALCYARLYLKALIMYEEKEFGDTDKLNALIYEDTLKLDRDIQDQYSKEFEKKGGCKMKLYEFCEKFVAHNTYVCLVQEIIKTNEEGVKQHEYNKIWQGMDWQIVQSAGDEDYFKAHPDVEKCPFKSYNVAKVIGNIFNAFPETADNITIVIGL